MIWSFIDTWTERVVVQDMSKYDLEKFSQK